MTALCGGGTSGPKPNTAVDVILTASQLASFLTNKIGLWAALVSGSLGVLTFATTQFCASDPPAQPTITPDEYKALLELGPPDLFQSALSKLRDLVLIAMWYELCACTTGTTPQPPANLYTPPAGVGVQDYTTTVCANSQLRTTIVSDAVSSDPSQNITQQLFPNLQFTQLPAGISGFPPQPVALVPSNWSGLHAEARLISGSTPTTSGYSVTVVTYGANFAPAATINDVVVGTGFESARDPLTGDRAIDHNRDKWFSVGASRSTASASGGVVDYSFFPACAGGVAGSISCGADPVLQALLSQILELCQRTREDVTLLQRYGLPFAYVRGPSMSGLTGTGSIALGRSVGLLIDVLGFPPANKQMLGEPPYIFDLGWVSALTPDGLVDEIRLTREHTTWLSKLIPSAELVGWGLRDGVQIRITELHAEP
jgi:hypothetical protein